MRCERGLRGVASRGMVQRAARQLRPVSASRPAARPASHAHSGLFSAIQYYSLKINRGIMLWLTGVPEM